MSFSKEHPDSRQEPELALAATEQLQAQAQAQVLLPSRKRSRSDTDDRQEEQEEEELQEQEEDDAVQQEQSDSSLSSSPQQEDPATTVVSSWLKTTTTTRSRTTTTTTRCAAAAAAVVGVVGSDHTERPTALPQLRDEDDASYWFGSSCSCNHRHHNKHNEKHKHKKCRRSATTTPSLEQQGSSFSSSSSLSLSLSSLQNTNHTGKGNGMAVVGPEDLVKYIFHLLPGTDDNMDLQLVGQRALELVLQLARRPPTAATDDDESVQLWALQSILLDSMETYRSSSAVQLAACRLLGQLALRLDHNNNNNNNASTTTTTNHHHDLQLQRNRARRMQQIFLASLRFHGCRLHYCDNNNHNNNSSGCSSSSSGTAVAVALLDQLRRLKSSMVSHPTDFLDCIPTVLTTLLFQSSQLQQLQLHCDDCNNYSKSNSNHKAMLLLCLQLGLSLIAWLAQDVTCREVLQRAGAWTILTDNMLSTGASASNCMTADATIVCNATATLCWLVYSCTNNCNSNSSDSNTTTSKEQSRQERQQGHWIHNNNNNNRDWTSSTSSSLLSFGGTLSISPALVTSLVTALKRHVHTAAVVGNIMCLLSGLENLQPGLVVTSVVNSSSEMEKDDKNDENNIGETDFLNVVRRCMELHPTSAKVQETCLSWIAFHDTTLRRIRMAQSLEQLQQEVVQQWNNEEQEQNDNDEEGQDEPSEMEENDEDQEENGMVVASLGEMERNRHHGVSPHQGQQQQEQREEQQQQQEQSLASALASPHCTRLKQECCEKLLSLIPLLVRGMKLHRHYPTIQALSCDILSNFANTDFTTLRSALLAYPGVIDACLTAFQDSFADAAAKTSDVPFDNNNNDRSTVLQQQQQCALRFLVLALPMFGAAMLQQQPQDPMTTTSSNRRRRRGERSQQQQQQQQRQQGENHNATHRASSSSSRVPVGEISAVRAFGGGLDCLVLLYRLLEQKRLEQQEQQKVGEKEEDDDDNGTWSNVSLPSSSLHSDTFMRMVG